MWFGKIYITYKKSVLDPQGQTVRGALISLGYEEVEDVRIGKYIEIRIKGNSKEEVSVRLKEMCDKLLVNPVIEECNFDLLEIK